MLQALPLAGSLVRLDRAARLLRVASRRAGAARRLEVTV